MRGLRTATSDACPFCSLEDFSSHLLEGCKHRDTIKGYVESDIGAGRMIIKAPRLEYSQSKPGSWDEAALDDESLIRLSNAVFLSKVIFSAVSASASKTEQMSTDVITVAESIKQHAVGKCCSIALMS